MGFFKRNQSLDYARRVGYQSLSMRCHKTYFHFAQPVLQKDKIVVYDEHSLQTRVHGFVFTHVRRNNLRAKAF